MIAAYSKAAGLLDSWHFVTGPIAAVTQVWYDYGVGVDIEKKLTDEPVPKSGGTSDTEPTQGLSPEEVTRAHAIVAAFGGGYDVSHSAPFWFIDTKGRIRASMDADALPSEIAFNLRSLAGR